MKPATPDNSIILVPTHRFIERETELSLRALEAKGWKVERKFGNSAIDVARNIMASRAYFSPAGYEWLFWIDSDIDFEAHNFEMLAALNEPFCCAPYAQKMGGNYTTVLSREVDKHTRGRVAIDASGFGFMKTHRSVYESIAKGTVVCYPEVDRRDNPEIPFFMPGIWEREGRFCYYGEDYSFCLRAKEKGFQLIADFDNQIGHIGRWSFWIRDPL